MKINIDELSRFISRLKIEKMITELPVKIHQNRLSIRTLDKVKQVIVFGSILLPDPVPNDLSFSFPDLTKLASILDEFKGEVDVDFIGSQATFMDSLKSIKTEIIKTELYDAIERKFELSVPAFGKRMLRYKEQIFNYDDSIHFNGKVMKSHLEKFKSVKSPFYLIEQSQDIVLSSEYKLDKMKMKIDLGSKFKKDRSFWMVSFVKEIFKNNPYECDMYVSERNEPMLLDFVDKDGSYNTLTFIVAPRG